jgi:hypothetical protein
MVLGAEEEESPLEANKDKVALETLSKSSLSSSSLSLSLSSSSLSSSSSPLSLSPSSPSKEKGNLHPPHLLWKCQCNAWVLVSSSSSSPSSEDESKGRSELGNDQTCGTGSYMPLPQQKSRRRVILSMNNLTLRCHLGK